ncbi:MAG: putative molybdenum carrier protein [Acidobacteriota bacterium]|nr:putative molybdenum carrier protein [Acidobacteriota bacterium]MDQ7087793.1 putative molybdenum carrier protein [Acidobacteriota bacterium]
MVLNLTIVSGGQTGVDRAALDWALEHGVDHDGWCPAGRLAEDGPLPQRYRLRETASADPGERTARNVRDSDGTLVFCVDRRLSGGSALTASIARRTGRPLLVVPRSWGVDRAVGEVGDFIRRYRIGRLNIAGPRYSEEPEAGAWARRVLEALDLSG